MYGNPRTLFIADFMGSNNRLEGQGRRTARRRGAARRRRLAALGRGPRQRRGRPAPATGMIRLERVRLADGAGENTLKLPLVTSMYLGDRWEHLFHRGDLRLRAYGRSRSQPATNGWRFRGRASGSSDPRRGNGTRLAAGGRRPGMAR